MLIETKNSDCSIFLEKCLLCGSGVVVGIVLLLSLSQMPLAESMQVQMGQETDIEQMQCSNDSHILVIRSNGKPACVSESTAIKWGLGPATQSQQTPEESVQPELPAAEESVQPELPAAEESVQPELPAAEESVQPELPAAEESEQINEITDSELVPADFRETKESEIPIVLIQALVVILIASSVTIYLLMKWWNS